MQAKGFAGIMINGSNVSIKDSLVEIDSGKTFSDGSSGTYGIMFYAVETTAEYRKTAETLSLDNTKVEIKGEESERSFYGVYVNAERCINLTNGSELIINAPETSGSSYGIYGMSAVVQDSKMDVSTNIAGEASYGYWGYDASFTINNSTAVFKSGDINKTEAFSLDVQNNGVVDESCALVMYLNNLVYGDNLSAYYNAEASDQGKSVWTRDSEAATDSMVLNIGYQYFEISPKEEKAEEPRTSEPSISCAGEKDENCDGIITCDEEMGEGWTWNNAKAVCEYSGSTSSTYTVVNTGIK